MHTKQTVQKYKEKKDSNKRKRLKRFSILKCLLKWSLKITQPLKKFCSKSVNNLLKSKVLISRLTISEPNRFPWEKWISCSSTQVTWQKCNRFDFSLKKSELGKEYSTFPVLYSSNHYQRTLEPKSSLFPKRTLYYIYTLLLCLLLTVSFKNMNNCCGIVQS